MTVKELLIALAGASQEVLDAELYVLSRAKMHEGLHVNLHSHVDRTLGFLTEDNTRFYLGADEGERNK